MKKKTALFMTLIIALIITIPILFGILLPDRTSIKYIEKEIHVNIPNNAELVEQTDSHGGFHGDGTLSMIIVLPDNNETVKFLEEVKKEWLTSPEANKKFYKDKNKISLFTDDLSFIPYSDTAYYFYRDRGYEMYGETDSRPLNYTFACYYPDTKTLKFLEVDI